MTTPRPRTWSDGTMHGLSTKADLQITASRANIAAQRRRAVAGATSATTHTAADPAEAVGRAPAMVPNVPGASATQHRWASGLAPITAQPRHTGAYSRATPSTTTRQKA